MSNLMKHRWFELRHSLIFWLILVICCAFTLFLIGTVGFHYVTDTPIVAGVSHDWMGLFMNATADCILPLIIISDTFTTLLLGQQFSSRTTDQEIAAGYSRSKIFMSQCIVGFAVSNMSVLLSIFLGCLRWVKSIPMPSVDVAASYFARVIILLSILNFSFFSVCMIFIVLFRDIARTVGTSAIFLFVACSTMPAFEQSLVKAPGTIYPLTPTLPLLLHPAFLMRYALYATLTPMQVLWSVGVAIGWTILFLSIAYCIFRKCELK